MRTVYLNGFLLGFTHGKSMRWASTSSIPELEEFMDQKLKKHSPACRFVWRSPCRHKAQGDILVLDEVLAVGDEAFQRSAMTSSPKSRKTRPKRSFVDPRHEFRKKYCSAP